MTIGRVWNDDQTECEAKSQEELSLENSQFVPPKACFLGIRPAYVANSGPGPTKRLGYHDFPSSSPARSRTKSITGANPSAAQAGPANSLPVQR